MAISENQTARIGTTLVGAIIFDKHIYKTADDLISLANKHGGVDNISVAIARYSA